MASFVTKNWERIRQAIAFLTDNRRPITIKIEEEQTLFKSIIVKIDHGDPGSKDRTPGKLFIKWLSPPKGNDLIQSSGTVQVRFSLGKQNLAFTSYYVTKSFESPSLGHIITYPESLVIADRRQHTRHEVGGKTAPLFAKAIIRIREERSQENVYDFGVFDVSENGVGILVGKELFNWLDRIGIGSKLKRVELYAPWAIVRVDGTVKHKSKMRGEKYRDYQLLGIELDDKLEQYA